MCTQGPIWTGLVLDGVEVTVSVFVVEDSKNMQSALVELLEVLGGFEVLAAVGTETEATDWLYRNRGKWKLATLDLLIDEGSGFNLIRRCKESPDAGKVVVLSDYVTPVVKIRCLELGADAVFTKSEIKEFSEYVTTLKG
jgi:DNA-binding NarL/FixJ family response regulator